MTLNVGCVPCSVQFSHNVFGHLLQIVFKQLRQDDSSSSVTKPRSDSLMAQVSIVVYT